MGGSGSLLVALAHYRSRWLTMGHLAHSG